MTYILIAFFVSARHPSFPAAPHHHGVAMQEFTTMAKCEDARKLIMEKTKGDAMCVEK